MEGIALFDKARELCENSGAAWMIENPVGFMSTAWRKPDYTFDPCDYAGYSGKQEDNYTKKTCLWTSENFKMPAPRLLPGHVNEKLITSKGKGDGLARSVTPEGFAIAVFEANRREQ